MATKRKVPPMAARRTAKSGIPLNGRKRSAALESHTPQLPDAADMAEFESARSARVRESGRDPAPKTARRAVHVAAATDEQKRANAQFGGASGDPWDCTSEDVAAEFNSGKNDLNGSMVPWRDIAHAENVSSVLRSLIGQLKRNSTAIPYMTEEQLKSGLQSAVTMLNASPDPGATLIWLFVNAGDGATIRDKITKAAAKKSSENSKNGKQNSVKTRALLKRMLAPYKDAELSGANFSPISDQLINHFKFVALSDFQANGNKWKSVFEIPGRATVKGEEKWAEKILKTAEKAHEVTKSQMIAERKNFVENFIGKRFDYMAGDRGFVDHYFEVYLRQTKVRAYGVSFSGAAVTSNEKLKVVGLNYAFEDWISGLVTASIMNLKNEIRPGTKK